MELTSFPCDGGDEFSSQGFISIRAMGFEFERTCG